MGEIEAIHALVKESTEPPQMQNTIPIEAVHAIVTDPDGNTHHDGPEGMDPKVSGGLGVVVGATPGVAWWLLKNGMNAKDAKELATMVVDAGEEVTSAITEEGGAAVEHFREGTLRGVAKGAERGLLVGARIIDKVPEAFGDNTIRPDGSRVVGPDLKRFVSPFNRLGQTRWIGQFANWGKDMAMDYAITPASQRAYDWLGRTIPEGVQTSLGGRFIGSLFPGYNDPVPVPPDVVPEVEPHGSYEPPEPPRASGDVFVDDGAGVLPRGELPPPVVDDGAGVLPRGELPPPVVDDGAGVFPRGELPPETQPAHVATEVESGILTAEGAATRVLPKAFAYVKGGTEALGAAAIPFQTLALGMSTYEIERLKAEGKISSWDATERHTADAAGNAVGTGTALLASAPLMAGTVAVCAATGGVGCVVAGVGALAATVAAGFGGDQAGRQITAAVFGQADAYNKAELKRVADLRYQVGVDAIEATEQELGIGADAFTAAGHDHLQRDHKWWERREYAIGRNELYEEHMDAQFKQGGRFYVADNYAIPSWAQNSMHYRDLTSGTTPSFDYNGPQDEEEYWTELDAFRNRTSSDFQWQMNPVF